MHQCKAEEPLIFDFKLLSKQQRKIRISICWGLSILLVDGISWHRFCAQVSFKFVPAISEFSHFKEIF
jgi:hypothetical protein